MTVSPLNHYQVLMLDPEVDADLLATIYRRLVQRYQSPLDRSGAALQRLQAVEEAYTVLRDPHRRARYDAQLAERMRDEEATAPVVAERAAAPVAPVARPVPAPAAAPAGARAAFSRAPVAPQPVTRTAVPVVSRRPSSTRSVQVSVLDFGRYAGWSLRQLAARDPDYLEWLLRSPGGRQYRAEITALLEPRQTA